MIAVALLGFISQSYLRMCIQTQAYSLHSFSYYTYIYYGTTYHIGKELGPWKQTGLDLSFGSTTYPFGASIYWFVKGRYLLLPSSWEGCKGSV